MAHTPGPLTVDLHAVRYCIRRSDGVCLGSTPLVDDAKLWSSAPDLLAACKLTERNLNSIIDPLPLCTNETEKQSLQTWRRIVRDAIAKAGG